VYDGFGRPLIVSQSEDGAHYLTANFTTNALHVQTIYDSLGRAVKVSNPYRTTAAETDGWTRTIFDLGGRVIQVATFSGAYNNPPPDSSTNSNWTGTAFTTYSGEQTTVKDQADKQRLSKIDALGRLIQIDELNESGSLYATTLYSYDARGNLLTVNQSGQTRRFAYDGLSRLIRAKNPEQDASSNSVFLYNGLDWSVKYEYDASSNLTAKTDTRFVNGQFVKVSYGYDEINRVTSRSYTDGTPPVSYGYDTATKGVGQLSFVEAVGVSKYNYTAYDSLGRATAYNQQTSGQTYSMTNAYNKAGMVTSQGYPSMTKTVLTEYDGAGRVAGVKQEGASGYYAGATSSDGTNRIQYTAHGGASKMKLGNGLWEHTTFNSRLQPVQIGLGTASTNSSVLQMDYVYGASAVSNNGNVTRQTITAAQTLVMVQEYQYDQVNRLKEAKESVGGNQQWKQVYGYDTFGNRWVTVDSTLVPSPLTPRFESSFSASTNRIVASQYDGAGNQKVDGQGRTFDYDGENRQTRFNNGAGVYEYDGDGVRVKKTDGTGTTVYVYNVGGQLLAEYHSDPVPGAAGGGGVSYLSADHLGSTRVVTKGDGSVKARYDYLPFGEELGAGISSRSAGMGYSAADSTAQKFTSKERDSESGLDYFGARYYSSAQGRFTSCDPSGKSIQFTDPQTWNRYSYVLNNPLMYIDPQGKWPTKIHNQIIDKAFPGLSVKQRQILKAASARVDSLRKQPFHEPDSPFGGQDPKNAYQHSMRSRNQDVDVAKDKIAKFITNNEQDARNLQSQFESKGGKGLSDKALDKFGIALHTETDKTSPAHTDSNGNPIVWDLKLLTIISHEGKESEITPEQMDKAVDVSREAFRQTFGSKLLEKAVKPPTPQQEKAQSPRGKKNDE
jgi:RHS repeat-associated protein